MYIADVLCDSSSSKIRRKWVSYIVLEMFWKNGSFTNWWIRLIRRPHPLAAARTTHPAAAGQDWCCGPVVQGPAWQASPHHFHFCLRTAPFLSTPLPALFLSWVCSSLWNWGHRPHFTEWRQQVISTCSLHFCFLQNLIFVLKALLHLGAGFLSLGTTGTLGWQSLQLWCCFVVISRVPVLCPLDFCSRFWQP